MRPTEIGRAGKTREKRSRKNITQERPGFARQTSRKRDVKVDHEIAPPRRVLRVRQAVAGNLVDRLRRHDLVLEVDAQLLVVERRDGHLAPAEGLLERDARRVLDVRAVAREDRVRLVADDEGHVGGVVAVRLVALLGEGDAGAGLPAGFDVDDEHVVFLEGGNEQKRVDQASAIDHFENS